MELGKHIARALAPARLMAATPEDQIMATAAQHPIASRKQHARPARRQRRRELARIDKDTRPLLAFWTKINSDWIFNLSGLLAYSFMMSTFPILLVLLAVAGFVLGSLSPATLTQLQTYIGNFLPGADSAQLVAAVTHQLSKSAGILFAVGIVMAAFTGSRLFVTLELCFSVIFLLRYAVLIPVIALASLIPTALLKMIGTLGANRLVAMLTNAVGIAVPVVFAAILFAAIYLIVPNRPLHLRDVWKGTLLAAGLLVVYQILFPIYERLLLRPGNYGSVAGFAIVILIFFYYFGFIVLLGAEVNSWAAGQRQPAGGLPTLLHVAQTRTTTHGAPGATASQQPAQTNAPTARGPQDPSAQTPTPAATASTVGAPGAVAAARPPLSARERSALVAVLLAAIGVAAPIAVRLFGRGGRTQPLPSA
jgi:membrane protein